MCDVVKLWWKRKGALLMSPALVGPFCTISISFRLSFYFVLPLWSIVFEFFNVSDQILFAEWREAVQTCGNARKGEFETMVDETTLVS